MQGAVGQAGKGVVPEAVTSLGRSPLGLLVGRQVEYHPVDIERLVVRAGDGAALLGDPAVVPRSVRQAVLDRERPFAAQLLLHELVDAGAVLYADHRLEAPPVRLGELAGGITRQNFDVVANEDHVAGLCVKTAVDGTGNVEDEGPELLFVLVPGLPGPRNSRVHHRGVIHLENCRRQLAELDQKPPSIDQV